MLPTNIKINQERDKILNYSKELFFKEGFYKITMDTVASDLRISKKTIYKNFNSKESLIKSIVQSVKAEISENLDQIISSKDNSVLKLIGINQLLGKLLMKLNDKWINDLKVYLPELWNEIDEFRTKRLYAAFSSIISKGQEEELIKGYPADMMVMIFLSTLRGVVNNEFLLNSRYSYKDAVGTSLQVLFSGILTAKGKKIFKKSFSKV
ncbi:MAG: TetR/AcrR family transcriptional regulator [Ignavibacteria bacterium]